MPFDTLIGRQFIALTTHRRDGTPVPTTVWFAHHGAGIVVPTSAGTGKVKRIRRDASVEVAASNFRGKHTAAESETESGVASILDPADASGAWQALADKYGLQWRLLGSRMDTVLLVLPRGVDESAGTVPA
jgi:uncharacterized protein